MSTDRKLIGSASAVRIMLVEHDGVDGNYDEIVIEIGDTSTSLTAFEARSLANLLKFASSELERKLKRKSR